MHTGRKAVMICLALILAITPLVQIGAVSADPADDLGSSSDNPYTFRMYIGDSFVYNPQANLVDAVIAIDNDSSIPLGAGANGQSPWVQLTDDGSLAEPRFTLSGTATPEAQAAGSTLIHLVATHTAGDLTQRAHQYIRLDVEKHTDIQMDTAPANNYVVVRDTTPYARSFTVETQNVASVSYTVTVAGLGTYNQSNKPDWMSLSYSDGVGCISFDGSLMDNSLVNRSVSVSMMATDIVNGDVDSTSFSFFIYNADITLTPSVTEIQYTAGDPFPGSSSLVVRDTNENELTWEIISVSGTKSNASDWSIDDGRLTYIMSTLPTTSELEERNTITWTITVRATLLSNIETYADCMFIFTILPDVTTIAASQGYILQDANDKYTAICYNTTDGSASCLWNFGDGSKVVTRYDSVSHKYAANKIYDITQIAYNESDFAFNPAHYFFSAGNTFTPLGPATPERGSADSSNVPMNGIGWGTVIFISIAIIGFLLMEIGYGWSRYLILGSIVAAIVFMFVNVEIGSFIL